MHSTQIDDWADDWFQNLDTSRYIAGAAKRQVMFLRDEIPYLFGEAEPNVIGTHYSKSCQLPVVQYSGKGVEVTVRGNFYDWTISVSSEKPVDPTQFNGLLINPGKAVSDCYAEGFPKELVYGTIEENPQRFTVQVSRPNHILFTFMFILMREMSK